MADNKIKGDGNDLDSIHQGLQKAIKKFPVFLSVKPALDMAVLIKQVVKNRTVLRWGQEEIAKKSKNKNVIIKKFIIKLSLLDY